MNRYPAWKYALLVIALLVGLIYTLPNFFGEAPAVQISSGKATLKLDSSMAPRVADILAKAELKPDFVQFEGNSVKARFADLDAQRKARDAINASLNPDPANPSYIVALNLLSRSPGWLTSMHALPMFLGLDLRGGVYFLMQVDMKSALTKKAEALTGDIRTLLRDKNLRHAGISRDGNNVDVRFRDRETLTAARSLMQDQLPDLQWIETPDGTDIKLSGSLKPEAAKKVQDTAITQNITTLHNRVNELGVAEPVIQQQGPDRVVVQLPGVQDTAKAKDIIGRTATLELRMVDDSAESIAAATGSGPVPFGTERFTDRDGSPLIVKRQVVFTGDNLSDAQPGFDGQNARADGEPDGGRQGRPRIMKDVSRDNIGKRMAILLFEKGKGEVVTAPVIRGELGSHFQITGRMTASRVQRHCAAVARRLAGRADGHHRRAHHRPESRCREHHQGLPQRAVRLRGRWRSSCACTTMLFGVVLDSLALGFNLLLLVAVLSMLQATLSLPGIAAIALTLGMAIDSNVLINERVREELRAGAAPQTAIHTGYERAFATILDSNVTTLIAGLALLAFGSGPVRGFAVVHCLGILTSMFSSVVFSRGLVNLWYGRQKKLKSVWRSARSGSPQADVPAVKPRSTA